MSEHPLKSVEVLTFDVFGTVVDWQNTGVRVLKEKASASSHGLHSFLDDDWTDFMQEWRKGYMERTTSAGLHGLKSGSLNVDVMHREILDEMLKSDSERWKALGATWGEADKHELVLLWHRLDGWPDSSSGLKSLKENAFIVTLSNGNVRLLADMARHADLPWDVILTAGLLGGFKPDPRVYLGALEHLSVAPENCAMVAAHIYDLRAAAIHGMKTVYVRRATEDVGLRDSIKAKSEGGEVDVVVNGLDELATLLKAAKSS